MINNYNSSKLSENRSSRLTAEEIKYICSYLENPTKTGIWTLKCKRNEYIGLNEYLKKKIDDYFNKNEIINDGKRKIKLNDYGKQSLLNSLNNLSFIFYLFQNLISSKELDEENMRYFYNYREERDFKIIIENIINIDEIKNAYSDALDFFKNEIFFENFTWHLTDDVFRIKDGFLLITNPRSDDDDDEEDHDDIEDYQENSDISKSINDFSMVSIRKEPLEKIKIFFEKIGIIIEPTLMPIFSPEEDVFKPYISFLKRVYIYLISNVSIKNKFNKSIVEYYEGDFNHCIATTGLILEDYLVQIYETIFRETSPTNLTLGELFNSINNKIKKIYSKNELKTLRPDIIFKSIRGNLEKEEDKINISDVLKILRQILIVSQNDKHEVMRSINYGRIKGDGKSIFPKQLTDNIQEAIRNRNATSHKTTIPIGHYEALRNVYCCIKLIIWWNNEKKMINWENSKELILNEIIDRNSVI